MPGLCGGIITIQCVTECGMLFILGFHQLPSTQNKRSSTIKNRSYIQAPIKMKDESEGKERATERNLTCTV
jgi:hypothetical protein